MTELEEQRALVRYWHDRFCQQRILAAACYKLMLAWKRKCELAKQTSENDKYLVALEQEYFERLRKTEEAEHDRWTGAADQKDPAGD